MKNFWIVVLFLGLGLGGCTEEAKNKFFRSADNILGKDLKVTFYSDKGDMIKSWTVLDGKITTGKDENGAYLGYYYFWADKVGYVQVPVDHTVIEEIR